MQGTPTSRLSHRSRLDEQTPWLIEAVWFYGETWVGEVAVGQGASSHATEAKGPLPTWGQDLRVVSPAREEDTSASILLRGQTQMEHP